MPTAISRSRVSPARTPTAATTSSSGSAEPILQPARAVRVLATALVLACALAGPAHAETFAGKVVAIHDGDTLSVMRNGRAERVRLDGIDAPERGQAYTKHAKLLLSEIVFGRTVEVEVKDTDRYGRIVGRVRLGDRDVGLELVRAGLAWHFTRYSADPSLARAEREARAARRGLWAQPDPMPPWAFRQAESKARRSARQAAPR